MSVNPSIDLSLHPRLQSALIGHSSAVESLERALKNNTLPQAWIFFGPKGVGKATCAYQFSRQLFREESPFNADFINRQIMAGTYPNFLLIEKGVDEDGKPKNNITVDDIRKINDFIHHSAPLPGWRLILIDGAEDMNRNAANALLKALEEPPQKTLFILISHRMGQLLPTIKSRCCSLSFSALSQPHMSTVLSPGHQNSSPDETPALETDLEIALEMAQGSPGRFHDLTHLKSNDSFKQIIHLLPLVLKGDFSKALEVCTSFEKGNEKFPVFLTTLEWVIYQLCVLGHTLPSRPEKGSLSQGALRGILPLASPAHWLSSEEKIRSFLLEAKQSHLNQSHILMACFYLIHSPHLPVSCE